MTNFFESGLNWLSQKQNKFTSSQVTYLRNEKQYLVRTVLGRTKYEIVDDNGFRIASHVIDFLIRSSDLELIPQSGDQILFNNHLYEVIDLGDGCWQWCDPFGITRRIHTSIYKENL
jgi:hypothetical protein